MKNHAAPGRISGSGVSLFLPIVLVFVCVYGLPLIRALWGSFFTTGPDGEAVFCGLLWYRFLLSDRALVLAAGNTLLWALVQTLLVVVAGERAAFWLRSRGDFRVRRWIYVLVLIPWGMPAYTAVPLWRAFFHGSGGDSLFWRLTGIRMNLLTDPVASFIAASVAGAWLSFPSAVFILYGALRQVPKSVREAARMDGATGRQIRRLVEGPEVAETKRILALSVFLKNLKEFTVIFLMTAGGPPTLFGWTDNRIVGATTTVEVLIHEIFFESGQEGLVMAMSVIMAIVLGLLALVSFLINKRPQRGRGTILFLDIPGGFWTCLLLIGSVILPVILVLFSLSSNNTCVIDESLLKGISFGAWGREIGNREIWRAFGNTLILAFSPAFLVPLVCLPAARSLSKRSEEAAGRVFLLLQAAGILGGMHALVPLFALVRSAGALNRFWPLVLISLSHTIPLALMTLTASLRRFPPSLEDAARLEGLEGVRYSIKVLAPLLRPTIISVMMIGFLNGFNSFLAPLMLLSDNTRYPVSVKLQELVGVVGSSSQAWSTFSVLSLINLGVLALVLGRFRSPLGRSELDQVEPTG